MHRRSRHTALRRALSAVAAAALAAVLLLLAGTPAVAAAPAGPASAAAVTPGPAERADTEEPELPTGAPLRQGPRGAHRPEPAAPAGRRPTARDTDGARTTRAPAPPTAGRDAPAPYPSGTTGGARAAVHQVFRC